MLGSRIYRDTLKDLRSGVRSITHQGGQWSGKTVNILAALATCCAEETPSKTQPSMTTITSMSIPHLKGGALSDFENYVYPDFSSAIKKYNRTDHLFTFSSGMKMEFKTFESEIKASGAKRKRLFVNEANSFPWMIFYQLNSRSEQTIIDYNPSAMFWAHEKVNYQDGNKMYISDHRHNKYLKPEKHLEIENNPDFELWKVYARGLTGNVTGVIFPNWQMIDVSEFPSKMETEWFYAIDFGYTVDPTALMRMCVVGRNLFVHEMIYEIGVTEYDIMNLLRADGFDFDEEPLYCENDRDMIRELRNVGIHNAVFARKGPGTIKAGIEALNKYNVYYTNTSRNLHRERGLYVWTKDKDSGKILNIPVETNNHCFDAIRYGVYTKYLKQTI